MSDHGVDGAARVDAVRSIDLRIGRGEIVALLGPNGAGKTTTIDILLGLSAPSSGTVEVLGAPPREAVQAGRLAAVLQTGGLLGDLRVGETLRLFAELHGVGERVPAALERAELSRLVTRRVGLCSGGEQQRLKVAIALISDPEVLVLDEPTAGMDVAARHAFWRTMRLEAERGLTIVFATHYLEEAESFAERIALMSSGRVVADDDTAALRARLTGRTVSATVPDAGRDGVVAALTADGRTQLTGLDGGRVHLRSTDSDAVALALLTRHGARDLEITAPSLDDIFLALTSEN
ncbi:ABC transporter ATP-binding protein [Mycetocola reblochoni]|uniref:Putative ABC transporter ATP-binding protein n=1 Tax=Mycetocola reblochoni REB411 TaxID=1255698 RepID=A0A1R4K2U1_9MICO|nr:ABC transporter ATP-binding protein [Mycetocola reblochoni]SJN38771.1 putative ABC transporter ATP-binding protein [Mycetocola reblochoni REB411]